MSCCKVTKVIYGNPPPLLPEVKENLAKHSKAIAEHFRKAVTAVLLQWDEELAIEKLLGCEISGSEEIRELASSCDTAEDVAKVSDEDIIRAVSDSILKDGREG
jgi:hypothetical protein